MKPQTPKTRNLVVYEPHEIQLKFHNSTKRYRLVVCGRQVGKSTMALNEMAIKAWTRPGTRYSFISPIFSQAKEQYRRMISMLPPEIIAHKSDTELSIELINKSTMEFLSGDNPNSIRGKTRDGVFIDEVRDQDPQLWTMVARPLISTTNGFACFFSTPSGFDHFYDLAQKAKSHPDWEVFSGSSAANPLITPEEIDSMRQSMSEAEFAQEIMAEFRDLVSGKAYMTFGEHNIVDANPFMGVITSAPHPVLPIVVAMDFNLNPMAWTLGQYRGEDFYWFSEIYLRNSHTQEAVKELIDRVRCHKPGLIIVGDATGKAGQRAAAGQSDYDIIFNALTQAGIKFINRVPDSNPAVKDRVNTMNAACKSADGSVHMFVNRAGCPHLIKDMQRVAWKQGASLILDQTKDPDLTHSSDGVGYAHCVLAPLRGSSNAGTLKVIYRW